MKLNKIMMAALLTFGAATAVQADQGSGRVTFNGTIIDAPCSVSPDSEDQTVALGQIARSQLENSGSSTPRNFEIRLENCDASTQNTVSATFTGSPSQYDADSLGVTGTGGGVSVVLTDGSGAKIVLGTPTAARPFQNGNTNLVFSAFVQGGGAAATITEGQFTAVTDFTLAYP